MRFTPIVGTLSYVWNRDDDEVLLIRRNARPDDDHFGKVNGLGGKVEVDEDIATSACREVSEEAGIEASDPLLRGTITFSDFGPSREQWLVFVFLITAWNGTPLERNDEGQLEWLPRQTLLDACATASVELPLWAGDRHFLPLVFDEDRRVFHGTMPYDGDRPLSWSHVRLTPT